MTGLFLAGSSGSSAQPAPAGPTVRRRSTAPAGWRSAPWPLLVPALVGAAFLVVPLVGLLLRVPWRGLPELLTQPQVREALWLSLRTATVATAVSLVFGVPLAWLLARTTFPGRSLLRALVTVPLVLPPVVSGVALLFVLGRRGVIGQYLDSWFGITIPFTTTAVVIAQVFVAMPFLVVAVEGALASADRRYEQAAATLGAGPWTTFRRVVLPAVAPAVGAGTVLCWARALGEFGATITFAGSFPGTTQTMPLAVYLALESEPEAALALSLVLLVVAVAVLVTTFGIAGRRDRATHPKGRTAWREGASGTVLDVAR